ncbi:hypothetical protein [Mycobacterium sp. NPDC006124]|uniref:hypothetical protein n=1 Tax=Mycobacterium sp. NPDC006124 TaxID=3156729 RepID=UPI0033B03971
MLVNPDLLRGFAQQVDVATAAMRGSDLQGKASSAADGLPGSTTQWATREVGEHLGLAAHDIIRDVAAMGIAVRGAGDHYEVEDDSLATNFNGLF